MPKSTRDKISQMDLANIQARKALNIETDNAIRDYYERQGVIQIRSQLKRPTTYDEKLMKEFEMTHKIDEKGNPIIFETTEPPPELVQQPELENYFSGEDAREIQRLIEFSSDEIQRLGQSIKDIHHEIENIRDRLNQSQDGPERELFSNQLRNQHTMLIHREIEIRQRRRDYQHYTNLLNENNNVHVRNEAKMRENEKENEQIKKDYDYRAKLNRTRINTERQPGESEENYHLRIQSYQPSLDEVRREAYLWKYESMKNTLKEFIRNPAIIEQVLNGLTKEEIVEFDKYSAFLKNEFTKTFGSGTEKLSANEIIRFFRQSFSRQMAHQYMLPRGDGPSFDRAEWCSSSGRTDVKQNKITQYFPVSSPEEPNGVRLSPEAMSLTSLLDGQLLSQDNGRIHASPPIDKKSGAEAIPAQRYENDIELMGKRTRQGRTLVTDFLTKKYPEMLSEEFSAKDAQQLIRNAQEKEGNLGMIFEYARDGSRKKNARELISQVKDYIQSNPRKYFEKYDEKTGEPILTGFGLSVHQRDDRRSLSSGDEMPKKFSLGKIILDLHKLYFQNMLSVRDKNNYVIPGMNVVRVSDEFMKLILKLCFSGEGLVKEDIKSLSISERQLYDNLLFLSGLHKENYSSSKKTIEHWKEQEKILRGEVEAGNNNPEIYSKYKQILHKLQHFGVISASNVKNSLRELRSQL